MLFPASAAAHRPRHRLTPLQITHRVFGRHWREAWCVSFYESHHYLGARNGVNLGPWQISVSAHPWVHPWALTHGWWYSAKAARRIARHVRNGIVYWDWSPWTTHSACGV